ncbi:uncharacterized protein LOC109792595 [Cajanus cajan]|uniref:uncharacterized protein LOC109792595 n=1 Tax=Cajanus cajan TaxID=3821 RepID=UPI00098DABCA|nr:uncharacterized protein LOC109792595 [Cajanus cajan]
MPGDMNDLRHRAEKYMQMEELAKTRNQARADEGYSQRDYGREPVKKRNIEQLSTRPSRGPRHTTYMPLNESRTKILEQALASKILIVPKRANTPLRTDKAKTCRYHYNRGHYPEECPALKDKLEDLIKQGHLRSFVNRRDYASTLDHRQVLKERSYHPHEVRHVRDHRGRSCSDEQRDHSREGNEQPRKVINIIARGFAGEGAISLARKRHLRLSAL